MPFWPFRRKEPKTLTPEEVRERLVQAAASGSRRKLRKACNQYKAVVAANVEMMRHVPETVRSSPALLDNYVQCLCAAAQCLAAECGAPELWSRLSGAPGENPLVRWQRWCDELSPHDAMQLARKAAADHPNFAAFHLALGDLHRNHGKQVEAGACYRRGLECVAEPDLESRLLCALAGMLPEGSTERPQLVQRALALKGSLVAQAAARLMQTQNR